MRIKDNAGPNTALGNLVKQAKGEDRSLRDYARDAGIDPAVLSRMINGIYTPQKPSIYRALTSSDAKPRNGVTYEQLIKAAQSTKAYQDGVKAGLESAADVVSVMLESFPGLGIGGIAARIGAAGESIGTFVGEKIFPSEQAYKEYEKRKQDHKKFAAMAKGLVLSSLAGQGILFREDHSESRRLTECIYDTYLDILDQEISEYMIRYTFIDEWQVQSSEWLQRAARKDIEEMVFAAPDPKRKVSVVINSEKAFDYLCSFERKLSYNGDLSVIWFDESQVKLMREVYLSRFHGSGASDLLYVG